ncbi:MAG: hypothetical protein ACYC8T_09400 [Myxococcaceae bacterium]
MIEGLEDILVVQQGMLTRSQALACGMTRDQVQHRLVTGNWTAVLEGVYRCGPPRHVWVDAVQAQVLRTGGVVSHRCAAALWGMDQLKTFTGIELVTTGYARGAPGIRIERVSERYFDALVHERGMEVTSVHWTLAMLGKSAPPDEVEWAVDWAVRKGWTTWDELDRFVEAHARRGRAGLRVLRAVLDRRGPGFVATESLLETLYLQLLRRAGLPKPVQQFPVQGRGQHFRVDFAFPGQKLLVETLGRKTHAPQFNADRRRVGTLLQLMPGWLVLEFTYDQVTREAKWVAKMTRHFLGRHLPPGGR